MARVIISAGHTQNEPGAIAEDLKEVDLTRKIANKVTTKLRNEGIITISIPPELELPARIDWINRTGYKEETEDICIEFHINDGGKSGIEGWYKDKGDNKSQKLTRLIIDETCKQTSLANQGIKSEFDHPLKTLAFLHDTNPTSALIECLYIDNPDDQKFLRDDSKLELLAKGIVEGILKFFDINNVSNTDNIKTTPQTSTPTSFPTIPQAPAFGQTTNTGHTPPPIQSQPYIPYSSPSLYGRGNSFGAAKQPVQNREERKKMMRTKYQQILGRKVNDQDLNYFLNLGLSEDQMLKKLVESQEHADMVKDSQSYQKVKPKYDKQKITNQKLKMQATDKNAIIQQQNDLIAQKNKSIYQLQHPSEQSTPQQEQTISPSPNTDTRYQAVVPQKETFIDKILKKLNDIFD